MALVVGIVILRNSAGGDAERQGPSNRGSVREGTAAPPATAPADSGPPYAVGVTHVTLVDPTRGAPARGPTPASPERALTVTVRYPVQGVASAPEAIDAPAFTGLRSLILFAHGLALADQTYPRYLHDLAAAGFVVAVPEFPLSSGALPGPATSDVVEQARDLGFLVNQFLEPSTQPVSLRGVTFDDQIGVVGHSDGGITAMGFAANSCCADARVGAVVSLAGALGRFSGGWFTTAAPPTLVVHGDADTTNPMSSSASIFAAATGPKLFAVVNGGSHIGAFEDDESRAAVVALTADFLRAHLLGDGAAAARLTADAQIPGVIELRGRGLDPDQTGTSSATSARSSSDRIRVRMVDVWWTTMSSFASAWITKSSRNSATTLGVPDAV